MYLNSILIGKGAIAESRKGIVYSRFVYLGVAYSLLLLRFGLISVVIANLIAPFIQRFLLVKYFYKKEIKDELKRHTVTKKELRDCFETIWYNARKRGLVSVGAFSINKSGLFFAGLFLSAKNIASYGLMMQLVGVINAVSTTMFTIHQPVFAGYRVHRNQAGLLKDLSLTAGIFYFLFVLCALCLIVLANPLLSLIKSNSFLPNNTILVLYLAVVLLEQNHSFFGEIIASNNIIPYVKPALVSGFFIIAGTYMILKFSKFELLGMILVQGIVQLCYNNWKWPMVVCKELKTSFGGFLLLSFRETAMYCKGGINGLNRLFKK
jgi:O-antigen/teichoic acid export membrane protein